MRHFPSRLLSVALLVAVVTAGACAAPTTVDPTPSPSSPPTGSPATEAPSEMPTGTPIQVDFTPGGAVTELDNGWTIQHCEGDAPLMCVSDGSGRTLGVVELTNFPTTAEIDQAIDDGTLVEALEALVADQHTSIADDRSKGCGADYEYRPAPATHATVGGNPAVVYGFSGFVDDTEVERHRAYYSVHGGQLWVMNAAASSPDGCMADGIGQFTPADLAEFEPYLVRIAAGLDLP